MRCIKDSKPTALHPYIGPRIPDYGRPICLLSSHYYRTTHLYAIKTVYNSTKGREFLEVRHFYVLRMPVKGGLPLPRLFAHAQISSARAKLSDSSSLAVATFCTGIFTETFLGLSSTVSVEFRVQEFTIYRYSHACGIRNVQKELKSAVTVHLK